MERHFTPQFDSIPVFSSPKVDRLNDVMGSALIFRAAIIVLDDDEGASDLFVYLSRSD